MKKNPAWAISGAAIGSSVIAAVTILHFIQTNRAGVPGGYAAFLAGAIGVGLLAAIFYHLYATPEQRARWEMAGGGYGIHWPEIDEDLSTEGLLRGAPAPGAD